jgi:phage-related protein
MTFETEGLKEISPEVKDANKELNNFEKNADKAEKSVKKFNQSAVGSVKNLQQLAMTAARTIAPFILLGKAITGTMAYASQAIEVAEAAAKAGMSIEEFQAKDGNKYTLFTREDINNAKEFEHTMRDVRMGTAAIGANIAKMLLPALTVLARVAKQVVDFFVEHGDLIKASFIALAVVITVAAIPAIISMGAALWSAMAPLLPFIALAVGLALVFEDLYKWFKGEPSVAELLFGDFETVKNNVINWFNDIKTAIMPFLETVGQWIQSVLTYFKALFRLVSSIFSYIADTGQPIFTSIGEALGGFLDVVKNIGKFVLDIVGKFLKIHGIIMNIFAAGMNAAADKIDGSHANGLDYVPFDNYTANLHKGEAVLTASEADDWRSGVMAAKKAINFTANYPLNAIPSGAISNAYNNDTNKVINIGDIIINTQATDSAGIAADFKDYIKQAMISLDDGMLA